MIKIEFQYKDSKTNLLAKNGDKIRKICTKFAEKSQIDINHIYFMYLGNIVNLDLHVEQIVNKTDNERKLMEIIVIDRPNDQVDKNIIIPKFIICPICQEAARYEINNYRIKIYNCKNGHVVDDILLKEFESTQLIDESLIICDQCEINTKNNSNNKEMFICNKCNMKLCPLCRNKHDQNHEIINFEQKYYICNIHNCKYDSYCDDCNIDICNICQQEHKDHKIIDLKEIIPKSMKNKEEIKTYLNRSLKILNTKLEMIKDRLNNILKNIEIYMKLIERNLVNYNINNINYNILQNINYNYKDGDPSFGKMQEITNRIMDDVNFQEFLPGLLKIYDEMNKNEIDLVYNIPEKKGDIKIFGHDFVENNKGLCSIIYRNKKYDLRSLFDRKIIKDNDYFKFKLKGINNVTNLEYMFEECSQLSPLSNFSNWDTSYALNMEGLFQNNKCLELPDISNFITRNVVTMNGIFEGCSSLKYLPDISKWNTSNVENMKSIFKGCTSLISLPDISKWDITLALDYNEMDGEKKEMFDGCSESLNIPEKFRKIK